MTVVDCAEGRNRIHHQQGWMALLIQSLSNLRNAVGHSGGCLIVNKNYCLESMVPIHIQLLSHVLGGNTPAPVTRYVLDMDAESLRHLTPKIRKVTCVEHQHPITRGKGVDDRRLPGSSA